MENNYNYLLEKYSILIHNLIIGEGNSKERLVLNIKHLYIVFGLEVPPDLQYLKNIILLKLKKFSEIREDNKIIVSSYSHSIGKMRKKTASRLIDDIYNLYIGLTCR